MKKGNEMTRLMIEDFDLSNDDVIVYVIENAMFAINSNSVTLCKVSYSRVLVIWSLAKNGSMLEGHMKIIKDKLYEIIKG